jgi:hypothetical protein
MFIKGIGANSILSMIYIFMTYDIVQRTRQFPFEGSSFSRGRPDSSASRIGIVALFDVYKQKHEKKALIHYGIDPP